MISSIATCSICKQQFPTVVLKLIIHIVNKEAYIEKVCPACQSIIVHNANYYHLGR